MQQCFLCFEFSFEHIRTHLHACLRNRWSSLCGHLASSSGKPPARALLELPKPKEAKKSVCMECTERTESLTATMSILPRIGQKAFTCQHSCTNYHHDSSKRSSLHHRRGLRLSSRRPMYARANIAVRLVAGESGSRQAQELNV